MDTLSRRLLALASALGLLLPLWACELEECDPDTDPTCTETDTGVTPTDTGGGGGGGTDTTDTTPTPEVSYRYVWIVDTGSRLSGSHPGADIDSVEVIRNGQSFFGTNVTDWAISGITNAANDPNRATGRPRMGANGHECDVNARPPHWFSLAGEYVVVDLGAQGAIRDGDTLVVYECGSASGGLDDSFDVYIGASPRVDSANAQWFEVATDATGTATVPIRFSSLRR